MTSTNTNYYHSVNRDVTRLETARKNADANNDGKTTKDELKQHMFNLFKTPEGNYNELYQFLF